MTALGPGPHPALVALACVAALVLALVGVESWERTYAWPVADSWYQLEESDGRVTFRCQEYAPVGFAAQPRPGVVRVVLLGGSTTFGYPERPTGTTPIGPPEHGFAGVLQRTLEAAWPGRFELVNLGVNGGSSEDTLRLARRAMAWAPAAFVVYDGHNEYMAAPASFAPSLWRFAVYRHLMVIGGRVEVAPGWVGPAANGGPDNARAIVQQLRANLAALAAVVGDRPLVLATQASNLAGLDPSWSTSGADLADLDGLSDRVLAERAAASPEVADLAFRAGQRALLAGTDALPALRRAVDYDGLPFRATTAVNDAIRDAAAVHGFTLVDAEAAVLANAPPDGALFYDNVHPLPVAAARIAGAVLDGLARAGVLPGQAPAPLVPAGSPSDDAVRRTAGYWLRWACIRPHDPHWRLVQARRWAAELLARAPENADAAAITALADELDGGPRAALPADAELRRRLSAIHPRIAALVADGR